jgi:hypothetical protein
LRLLGRDAPRRPCPRRPRIRPGMLFHTRSIGTEFGCGELLGSVLWGLVGFLVANFEIENTAW